MKEGPTGRREADRRVGQDHRRRQGGAAEPWPLSHSKLSSREGLSLSGSEHFRQYHEVSWKTLVCELKSLLGDSEAGVLLRPDVRAAIGIARWVKAWAPDLLYSCFLDARSVYAAVTSRLLGIPWILDLTGTPLDKGQYAEALPWFATVASDVVVRSDPHKEQLMRSCGNSIANKSTIIVSGPDDLQKAIAMLRAAIARHPGHSHLGVARAFPLPAPQEAPLHPAPLQTPFVILGAERTGTNMVAGALAKQPGAYIAGELFNPGLIRKGVVPWSQVGQHDQALLDRIRWRDPADLVRRLRHEAAERKAHLVGFKILYYHAMSDHRVLEAMAAMEGVTVIHFKRANRLQRWVSMCNALSSGQWYTPKEANQLGNPTGGSIDPREAVQDFLYIELMENLFDAILEGRRCVTLQYDACVKDLNSVGDTLSDALGLRLAPLQFTSKKTGSDNLANVVTNWEALRRGLLGTRWESLVSGSVTQES